MTMTSIPLLFLQIFTLLVVFCSDDGADAFQTSFHNNMSKCHHQTQTIKSKRQPLITNLRMATTANSNNNNDAAGDDNKAMAFLRKVGRVGGAANMDFATASATSSSLPFKRIDVAMSKFPDSPERMVGNIDELME